jgi:hypothetical protein
VFGTTVYVNEIAGGWAMYRGAKFTDLDKAQEWAHKVVEGEAMDGQEAHVVVWDGVTHEVVLEVRGRRVVSAN